MGILALSTKLTLRGLRRILLFVCLTALLCIAAGWLGNSLLYGNASIVESVRVGIVDEDDTVESRMLIRYLTELEGYKGLISFSQMDASGAQSLLRERELDAALHIPKEFIAGVLDGRNMPFSVLLRGDSPLRAALIRVFAGIYADLLRTGQIGVYACLNEAREEGTEAYEQMFRDANLRFFTTMVSGQAMLEERALTATGRGGAAVQYAASTLVFVMLTGGVLFLDLWKRASSRPVLLRLHALGRSSAATGSLYLAGASFPFLLSGILLAGGCFLLLQKELRLSAGIFLLIPAILLLAFCSAALMMAVVGVFGGGAAGCVFLFLAGLFCLFVSGGILPSAYLSPLLRAAGSFTPHQWLTRLLLDCLAGEASPFVWLICLGWTALFSALSLLGIHRQGKVGMTP